MWRALRNLRFFFEFKAVSSVKRVVNESAAAIGEEKIISGIRIFCLKYVKRVEFFVSLVSPRERAITDRDPAILVKTVRAIFPPHFQKLHD